MRYNKEVTTTFGYAFLGGLLPSFIWLYFLLKEDARCPEPRSLIALAFIAGMAAVPLALPVEQYAQVYFERSPISVLTAWSLVEELLKYTMAALFILWRREVDEAPDYVVYMITVALGFAAAENMLFLISPPGGGQLAPVFFIDNLRFLGSTLVHVISSAAIGFAFAFSARSLPPMRVAAASGGLILAVVLHTAFNALIMNEATSSTLAAFFLTWTVAVAFFATFEVLKYFQYRNLPNNTC